jgi:hypothetical protein
MSPVFGQTTLTEVQSLFQGFMIFGTVLNTLAPLITAPLSLFIVSGILFLLAKLFQGDGSFEEHTYLIATVYAPLYLISQTVGLIPFLGWLVMVGLFFYQLLPGYYAIQAAHPRLSSRQALYVVLIPIGAITALFGLFFLVWFMLFFGMQFLRS